MAQHVSVVAGMAKEAKARDSHPQQERAEGKAEAEVEVSHMVPQAAEGVMEMLEEEEEKEEEEAKAEEEEVTAARSQEEASEPFLSPISLK